MDRYLSSGYELKLNNQIYTIISLIGRGATCAVYSAKSDEQKYIIKEYCPSYISFSRDENATVIVDESYQQKYYDGLNTFVAAYQKQKELRNIKGIVNSTPFTNIICEANNTMYFIVVPYEGATYKEKAGSLSIKNRIRVCLTMAKLACKYHKAGYLLLDIKPDNFFVIDETCDLIEYIDFDSIKTKNELRFGNCLSYTKDWAAPEQLIPYDYHNISEKTDIYAIGELVFWSVFGRHSLEREHRRTSHYSFENIDELKNPELQRMFTDYFHITIRPSVNNRADSMDVVIDMLNRIIAELDKECFIVPSCINANRIFLGRESEIKSIDEELSKNHILFLSGIGGIGKSELAKHYTLTTGMNCCYISYEGTLIDSIIKCIKIQNFPRFSDEPEDDYCIRKINMFKNLIADKYLIIIDNMNVRLSDLSDNDQKAWNELIECHSKILITTRCEDNEFPELQIKEIKDGETLVNIFNQYYENEYDEAENSYVTNIIEHIQKHTLLIELIAKQAKEEAKSPKAMYDSLVSRGIMNLGNSQVTIRKDNINADSSVKEFLKVLYDTSNVSDEQKLILGKLALMPNEGIQQDLFCEFFSIKDSNYIKWLSNNGWINRNNDNISIHPVIAEVAFKKLINTENCQAAALIYKQISKTIDRFGIVKRDFYSIYDSVALKTLKYKIKIRSAINFFYSYLNAFQDNRNIKLKIEITEYVISKRDMLKKIQYDDNRIELFYDIWVNLNLQNVRGNENKVSEICLERYSTAKDDYWKTIWGMNCYIISYLYDSIPGGILKGLWADWKYIKLIFNHKKSNVDYLYIDMRLASNYEFYSELDYVGMFCFNTYRKNALRFRKSWQKIKGGKNSPNNELMIAADYAIDLEYQNNNNEAIQVIQQAILNYSDYEDIYAKSFVKLHLLLAELFKKTGEFKKSEKEYQMCFKLEKDVYDGIPFFDYNVHIGFGHLLCEEYKLLGDSYERSFVEIVDILSLQAMLLEQNENAYNSFFIGEALFNVGYLNQIKGAINEAMKYYNKALDKYGEYSKYRGYKQQLSFMRIKSNIAEIEHSKGNTHEAVKLMEEVVKISKTVYGNKHDITISSKRKLDDYKRQQ